MNKGWPSPTLSEVCQIKPPKSEAREKVSPSSLVSFLPMENLGIDVKLVQATQSKPLSAVIGSYTYFADGDVLLAKITPCFENGKLGIANGLKNGIGFGSSEYVVLRPDATVSKEWLYYFLSRETFRVEGEARMTGAVGHKRVSKEFIETYPIPVPPLSEQNRIVGILDEAFEGIAAAKANAEQNLRNARAIFESYRESLVGEGGALWIRTTIGEEVVLQRGYDITKHEQSDGVVPVVSSGGVKSFHNRAMATAPGVVIGRKGTLGKVFYLESDFWPHDTTLWVKEFNGNDPRFVYHFFSRLDVKRLNSGSANPALNRNLVHAIEVDWPHVSLQKGIAARLDALMIQTRHLVSLCRQKLTALDALKQSLLHHAFSGQL